MGQKYWLGRELSALSMASKASSSEARLIHFQMAGNYSLKAATFEPFISPCELLNTREGVTLSVHSEAEVTSFFAPAPIHEQLAVAPEGFWHSCLLMSALHVQGPSARLPEAQVRAGRLLAYDG
jgi:hypothetical protein